MKRLIPRLLTAILVVTLLAGGLALPAQPAKAAVDASTFYLSWPYTPPPKGTLNPFSPDALTNNGFGQWSYLLTPTFGYYIWSDQKWEGWLVDKWGFSADGKKYTVVLKDGLTWSDGSPFTAKDVEASFNVGRVTGFASYSFGVDRVKAVDDKTVDFLLNAAPSLILERLILKEAVYAAANPGKVGDKATSIADLSARVVKLWDDGLAAGKKLADIQASDDWKKLAEDVAAWVPDGFLSSGPYTLDIKDVTDAQLTMRRSDKTFFGKKAKFDKIVVYKGDTEVTTPLLLTKPPELFYSTDFYPPATEKQLTDNGLNIIRAPSYGGPAIYFNFAVEPLNNQVFRQALAYAIDRQRVTKVSYDQIGKAPEILTGIDDESQKAWVKPDVLATLNKYEYNTKKAEEMLTAAGFKKDGDNWADPSGKKIELELSAPSDFTDWMPAAQDVVDQLNEFGIKVTLRAIPNSQHVTEVRAGNFKLALRLWGYPNPFPFYAYRNMYQRNAVAKTAKDKGMSYPTKQTIGGKEYDFDALVAAMSAGIDTAPQIEAVTSAAIAFNTDLPLIPLVERYYNCPFSDTTISGAPKADDPIWGNVSGSDNAIVVLLMNGTIGPK